MLRGAIWDLDGTILDSMSAWDHVGENYLRSQGIEPEPDLDEAIATMSLHQAADYFIEHYGVKQTRDELIKSAVAIVDDFSRYLSISASLIAPAHIFVKMKAPLLKT